MKTKLTTEQSQHLLDLGVLKEKASLILPTDSYEIEDILITTGLPIFKFEDFLNGEILPKFIGQSGLDIHIIASGEWQAMYYAYHPSSKIAPELIDALYQLACWYYGEYLKSEKK